jgi:hypothetical protein
MALQISPNIKYYVTLRDVAMGGEIFKLNIEYVLNPLTLELNPSTQRCLTRFFTRNFAD